MNLRGLRRVLCVSLLTAGCGAATTPVAPAPSAVPSAQASAAAAITAVPAPNTIAPTQGATGAGVPSGRQDSAEVLADALASALAQSDYARLAGLVTPTGWTAGFYQSEGTRPMTPAETIDWLRGRVPGGRIQTVVQPRPILPRAASQPPGDSYISSIWTNFASTPTQRVELMLRAEAGTWYWSGALFNAPTR